MARHIGRCDGALYAAVKGLCRRWVEQDERVDNSIDKSRDGLMSADIRIEIGAYASRVAL